MKKTKAVEEPEEVTERVESTGKPTIEIVVAEEPKEEDKK